MNIKQELILRTICAFESNGYAHFILSNLNPVMKSDHLKGVFRELEDLGLIKDETTNGYAKKIKVLKYLECPDFIWREDLNLNLKKYLLTCYKEYKDLGQFITGHFKYDKDLEALGLTKDIVIDAKSVTKQIHSTSELEYSDFGYKVVVYANVKEHLCQYCGETNPENFHKGMKSVCKKCNNLHNRNKGATLSQKLFYRSRSNASNINVDFNLDPEFIHNLLLSQNNKCKYSGIQFKDNFHDKYTYPTIDRIDSSKGYTKDNVCICTWYVNNMKNNATIDQFKDVITKIYENKDNF